MMNIKTFTSFLLVLMVLTLVGVVDADAQCAMCKGAAEANLKQGGGDPRGLNNGILYMLAMPYLLVGGIGLWWWRNRRLDRQAHELEEADFQA